MPRSLLRSATPAKAGPGRPRKLTREQIHAAALELMEEEGFRSLSMRTLAQKLGASPASLYNYIGHIEDVENGVLESLMGQLPLPSRARPEPMRLQLLEHLIHVRSMQMLHPHFLHAPVGSATWRQHMRATALVLEALSPDTNPARLVETVIGFNALIAFVSSTAERARTNGGAGYFEAERAAIRALSGKEFEILQGPLKAASREPRLEVLIGRLNFLIDRMLPHLAAVPPQALQQLQARLQDLIDGPWALRAPAKPRAQRQTKPAKKP